MDVGERLVPVAKLLSPVLLLEDLFRTLEANRHLIFRNGPDVRGSRSRWTYPSRARRSACVGAGELARTAPEGRWMHLHPVSRRRPRKVNGVEPQEPGRARSEARFLSVCQSMELLSRVGSCSSAQRMRVIHTSRQNVFVTHEPSRVWWTLGIHAFPPRTGRERVGAAARSASSETERMFVNSRDRMGIGRWRCGQRVRRATISRQPAGVCVSIIGGVRHGGGVGGGAVVGEYATAPLIGMMPSASSPLPRIGGCRVSLGLKGR